MRPEQRNGVNPIPVSSSSCWCHFLSLYRIAAWDDLYSIYVANKPLQARSHLGCTNSPFVCMTSFRNMLDRDRWPVDLQWCFYGPHSYIAELNVRKHRSSLHGFCMIRIAYTYIAWMYDTLAEDARLGRTTARSFRGWNLVRTKRGSTALSCLQSPQRLHTTPRVGLIELPYAPFVNKKASRQSIWTRHHFILTNLLGASSAMREPWVLRISEMESLDVRAVMGNPISCLDHFFVISFVDLGEREWSKLWGVSQCIRKFFLVSRKCKGDRQW